MVKGLEQVQQWAKGPPLNLGDDQVGNLVDEGLTRLQDSAGDLASTVLGGVSAVGNGLVTAALVLILVFFHLKDGPELLPWLGRQTGAGAARHVEVLATRGYATLSSFMRSGPYWLCRWRRSCR